MKLEFIQTSKGIAQLLKKERGIIKYTPTTPSKPSA